MIPFAPVTCASCGESGIEYYHCTQCRIHYCPECARQLEYRCSRCQGRLDRDSLVRSPGQ